MAAAQVRAGLAVLVLAAAAGPPATAAPATGSLVFEAVQAGARFTGEFREFRAEIRFDPADPAACRFDVSIATGSADTRESQRDDLLKGPDFFWVERHPEATYRGGGCRPADGGFTLDGVLSLRGVTRPVPLSFTWRPGSAGARLAGTARVRRLEFGVGQGEWADTQWVGGEVVVRFDLHVPAAAIAP